MTRGHADASRAAAEIVRYVRAHPDAADTVEGIARWWVGQRRFERADAVESAVAALVDEGVLQERQLPDGTRIYRMSGTASRD